jgi:alpha-L-fucosidase
MMRIMSEIKRRNCANIAKLLSSVILALSFLGTSSGQEAGPREDSVSPGRKKIIQAMKEKTYEANWESLAQWEMPKWFEDAVFGIYWHWGPYSVAGYGYSCWYGSSMYEPNNGPDYRGGDCYKHHVEVWGDPFTQFGYKDFIPLLTAAKWNPAEWAQLFKEIGADFAGPCAEHHDNFSMWDSKVTIWNSVNMGPHRDIVGDIAKALKARDVKFIVTFHNNGCNNWNYFNGGRKGCPEGVDVNNPDYYGLYGEPHDSPGARHRMCLKFFNKAMEVIDKYNPQMIWLEGCMDKEIIADYMPKMMAYYFNKNEKLGRGVVVTHKGQELPLACSPLDFEGGGYEEPAIRKWQTDMPLPGCSWAYESTIKMTAEDIEKGANSLVASIVDRTSKNGVTLLSIGPRADGTIPEYQIEMLKKLGTWMKVNKEALYGSKPAPFSKGGVDTWKASTIRFTEKDDYLYAIELKMPAAGEVIPGVKLSPGSTINMLGYAKNLPWHQEGGDVVIDKMPDKLPCHYAWSFKIKKADIAN